MSEARIPPVEPEPLRLPYSRWWPFVAGVAVGLGLRLLFSGTPGKPYVAMMSSFILLTPLLVGMVTIYVAERQQRRTWWYYVWAPALAVTLMVAGSLLIMIEGWICAILVVPLFALFGAVGGLVMGLICRRLGHPFRVLSSFAVLPLVLGPVEARLPLPQRVSTIERSCMIAAPPAAIWREIWNARDIRPEEVGQAWMYRIGVPLTQAGITEETPIGPVRHVTMGKGIHFDQVATQWHPERDVHWVYHFSKDSFPPAALDDHVRIGGAYFDLLTTSYTLTPEAGGTRLTLRIGYRVSTQFNWYAGPIADLLVGNFEEVILGFYDARSRSSTSSPESIAS